ncbi:MAG: hypothetical protein JWM96_179 [Alphaproteobacteria bacterium]|nr:hypothetical protein [Alphaproteobacteria bacterium]
MRSVVGNVPVIIIPLGRRANVVSATGWQSIREVQKELAAENPWISLTPEKFDQALFDDVHHTSVAYGIIGARAARKVLKVLGVPVNGADGPVLVPNTAVRSRTAVTIDLAHDAGNDFNPAALINGFRYFTGTTEIAVTGAVKTDNDSIALTLANEPPRGVEKLYYGYNVMDSADPAKLVIDNATNALPLRSATITNIARPDIAPSLASSVFVYDATLAACYPGTGQAIYNVLEAPADGSLQTAYDGMLGSTTAADSFDPLFTGSGAASYFTGDGNDYFRISSPSDFLKNLAVSGSFSMAIFFHSPAPWSGTPILFACGGNGSTIAGLTIRYVASSDLIRIATSDGAAGGNADIAGSAIPADTDCVVIITYNAATKSYTARINSATTVLSGTRATLKNSPATVASDIFANFTAGARFYRIALFNEVLDTTKARIVIDKANALHGRIYA